MKMYVDWWYKKQAWKANAIMIVVVVLLAFAPGMAPADPDVIVLPVDLAIFWIIAQHPIDLHLDWSIDGGSGQVWSEPQDGSGLEEEEILYHPGYVGGKRLENRINPLISGELTGEDQHHQVFGYMHLRCIPGVGLTYECLGDHCHALPRVRSRLSLDPSTQGGVQPRW